MGLVRAWRPARRLDRGLRGDARDHASWFLANYEALRLRPRHRDVRVSAHWFLPGAIGLISMWAFHQILPLALVATLLGLEALLRTHLRWIDLERVRWEALRFLRGQPVEEWAEQE